jgi:cytochrome b561
MCVCVCLFVCSGITLERLERSRPNLVHIWLYVCVRILYIYGWVYVRLYDSRLG